MKNIRFEVIKEDSGQRLDKYILEKLKDKFSRTYIQNLIEGKAVTVNGNNLKSHHKVKQNEIVEINLPEHYKSVFKPIHFDLDIVYEDEYIIVVNKPAGMIVHPVKKFLGNDEIVTPTLVNALLYHCDDLSHIGGVLKPGIVHRLDKETSGVIVVAKSDIVHRNLAEQFKKRKIQKEYIALVEGKIRSKKGIVDLPIGRSVTRRTNMRVSYVKGKDAVTTYEVIKCFDDYSLLKVMPKTGRTHQIRVHLAYLGHPVLGDKKYGVKNKYKVIARHALHAYKIIIRHPIIGETKVFTCPIPEDMREFIPGVEIIN